MNYTQIPGWYEHIDLNTEMVNKAKGGEIFVEVGSWLGRSTASLAQIIKDSGKPIKFYAVDWWKGSPGDAAFDDVLRATNGDAYPLYCSNIENCGVRDYVTDLRMTTLEGAAMFDDNSVDYLYLDASHDYNSVKADLLAWLPKMKKTSVISGHDLSCPGVYNALKEILPKYRKYIGSTSQDTWIYNISPNA
jgi:hypothetical protein